MSEKEQQQLVDLPRKGQPRQIIRTVQLLLTANEGLSDPQTMAALNVSRPCVECIHKRCVTGGLEKTLYEKC